METAIIFIIGLSWLYWFSWHLLLNIVVTMYFIPSLVFLQGSQQRIFCLGMYFPYEPHVHNYISLGRNSCVSSAPQTQLNPVYQLSQLQFLFT